MDDNQLFELLLEKKLISPPQLANAKNLQKQTGGSLQQLIVKLNYVKASELNSLMAEAQNMHAVEVDVEHIDLDAMKKIPAKIIHKYNILPLKSQDDEGSIVLAMIDPNDYQAVEEIQFLTGRKVEPALAPQESLSKTITYFFNHQEELMSKLQSRKPLIQSTGPRALNTTIDQILQNHNQKEIIKTLFKMLVEKNIISIDEFLQKLESQS